MQSLERMDEIPEKRTQEEGGEPTQRGKVGSTITSPYVNWMISLEHHHLIVLQKTSEAAPATFASSQGSAAPDAA